MKQILTIILILVFNYSFACECPTIDKKTLMENSEYVFIGTVIENVHCNIQIKNFLDEKKYGTEVKIKVESVLKGVIKTKYVIINQYDSGNCARNFKFGKQYLIAGIQIKGYINHVNPIIDPENGKKEESRDSIIEIPITKRIENQPLSRLIENYRHINDGLKIATFWNDLAKEYLIINTDMCISNLLNSEFGKRITKTE